ncbi:podocalyxin [Meriones unguiculatus]|uniref:podocalyxin n=1 Tax=Meriones unguiculatus TaxID=10047 RepID=UPI000B4E989D|nr:podocalyxin-like [Meriones unguiculatus]XP_021513196.1 podocalyxin [Meriones unguiculatus]
MRPTLAFSALLLLLPPPSLSQNAGEVNDMTTTKTNPPREITNGTSTKPTTVGPVTSTLPPAQPTTASSSDSADQPLTTAHTSTPDPRVKQSGSSPTPTSSSSQDDKTKTRPPSTSGPPSSSGQPVSSGGTDNVTTAPPTTLGSNQLTNNASSQPTGMSVPSKLPLTPIADSTTSPHQPMTTPSQSTESHPDGQHSPTTVSRSSGSVSSTAFSVSSRKPTTHIILDSPEVTHPTTTQMPDASTQPFSTPRQPTESPVGTGVMPTTEEFTHSSYVLTPVAPQGPSTPSSIWTFGHYKLKCDPAVMPGEELLILNLTGAGLCEGSPPNEKLVELLCHSIKASFNSAQDQCTLQVAPILKSQAVAMKRVTIETKLLPKAVYELLKEKWDDLREAGVSDMTLGREGPPEANEDRFSLPLIITIVCMASFLLLVAALYGCCHQRISQRKDQQRLTEELQTVENGYHDNPTLEVMETPSEMQEKKVVNLNGELGDSWIVPLDNLTKDDLDEEEDTHL